ncbi:MAG: sulfite exporter TauE/SafE family protein [Cyanobacteria bacterium J06641_5]
MLENWWLLIPGGVVAGLLAGMLGIGGGAFVVPFLTAAFGLPTVQAIGTSSLSIVMTSLSGTLQNWRMGNIDWWRTLGLGLATFVTVPAGVAIAERLPDHWLKACFGLLLLVNVLLSLWKRQVARAAAAKAARVADAASSEQQTPLPPVVGRGVTGGLAGFMAGLFGVGGGVIMVPLQMILLGETIKVAIQTSLSVIVLTGTISTLGHASEGNVLWVVGLILGAGGIIGAQVSTRFLPKLPERVVQLTFNTMLVSFAIYMFWQAWASYGNAIALSRIVF